MANKPHHGMRGLMSPMAPLKAGAHMPPRVKSGGNRKAPQTAVARNGALAGGHLKANSDTRKRSGAEGNGKGSPPPKGRKAASLQAHKVTAGRGGTGT